MRILRPGQSRRLYRYVDVELSLTTEPRGPHTVVRANTSRRDCFVMRRKMPAGVGLSAVSAVIFAGRSRRCRDLRLGCRALPDRRRRSLVHRRNRRRCDCHVRRGRGRSAPCLPATLLPANYHIGFASGEHVGWYDQGVVMDLRGDCLAVLEFAPGPGCPDEFVATRVDSDLSRGWDYIADAPQPAPGRRQRTRRTFRPVVVSRNPDPTRTISVASSRYGLSRW